LEAFDKITEEHQKAQSANEALEKRCNTLQQELGKLQEASQKKSEVVGQVLRDLQQTAKQNNDRKLAALAGKLSDMDDVYEEKPINRTDNVLVSQIAGEAIGVAGIDKVSYLKFDLQIAPDAAATMLSTNYTKAVRALTHLLDNAQKFTTSGSVTLRVAVDMMKMLAFYTVEDTGEGVEAAEAEHIFEPYVKLNQFFEGQGIGLTVARNIARRLGGDVVLDQGFAGPGSRFILTLPI
jgi:signal transduction histidine kinase